MEHGCLDWYAFLVFCDWQVDESKYLFASHHWGEVLLFFFYTCFFIVDVVIIDNMVLCKVLLASWIQSKELMLNSHGGFRKIPLHFLRCYWTKKSSMDIVKKHMVCRRPFESTDQTESCQLGFPTWDFWVADEETRARVREHVGPFFGVPTSRGGTCLVWSCKEKNRCLKMICWEALFVAQLFFFSLATDLLFFFSQICRCICCRINQFGLAWSLD